MMKSLRFASLRCSRNLDTDRCGPTARVLSGEWVKSSPVPAQVSPLVAQCGPAAWVLSGEWVESSPMPAHVPIVFEASHPAPNKNKTEKRK